MNITDLKQYKHRNYITKEDKLILAKQFYQLAQLLQQDNVFVNKEQLDNTIFQMSKSKPIGMFYTFQGVIVEL